MLKDSFEIVVKTFAGLEEVLTSELQELNVHNITTLNRAVTFQGNLELVYSANLNLRTALRVLIPIAFFKADNSTELYNKTFDIDWSTYLDNSMTFAIDSSVFSQHFNHENYVALKVKDAIVDQFRKKTGKRPSIDIENPSLRFHVHIANDDVTISLDSSGNSLHKRGYRTEQTKAPLNEVLAAGMILLTEWKGEIDFYDPMCGSGTLLMEAASIASNTPPGALGIFGFMKWKNFDNDLWTKVTNEAMDKFVIPSCKIYGSDISKNAIDISQKNILKAQFEEYIDLETKPFHFLQPKSDEGIIVINPPYGERLEPEKIIEFYKNIGDVLKQNFSGFDAWILSANIDALKHLGLKTSRRLHLFNGPLECSYRKYELYKGTKKHK